MTTLINLESYLDCCYYAHLFSCDPSTLVPSEKSLPLGYRDFCKKYLGTPFIPVPVLATNQPQVFRSRTEQEQLNLQTIGLTLPDQSSEPVFIVREANSLVLRSLQSRYLYANVYYYWSYVQQLELLTGSNKKLVIYNLDSFTPDQITPLTFESWPDAPYPIPIVDTRSLKEYDFLKLSGSHENLYNLILENLAKKVQNSLGLDDRDYGAIVHSLNKINIFQNLTFNHSEKIPLIIKINDRFYPYNLVQTQLEDIVYNALYNHLFLKELRSIINEHCQSYNFVFLSSYTKLSGIRAQLQQTFQNALFIPDIDLNHFDDIWKVKAKKSFPLFGQHLDKISFFVNSNSLGKIEIKIPDQVCYEGQQEVVVYGQYEKEGKLKRTFSLTSKEVALPFRINGEPLVDFETKIEQIYSIQNQYFETNSELEIEICFRLKPGLTPKLEVLDKDGRILLTNLVDRDLEQLDIQGTSGYIPINQIVEYRQKQSLINTQILLSSSFNQDFNELIRFLRVEVTSRLLKKKKIIEKISHFRSLWKDRVNPILDLNLELSSILSTNTNWLAENFIEILFERLTHSNKKAHGELILILGDLYAISQLLNVDFLFNVDRLSKPKGEVDNWVHQLLALAKISCSKSRQSSYLNLFHRYTRYREREFYKTNEYIWGYARLFLWYLDINKEANISVYSQHFSLIGSYCLTLNPNINTDRSYLQDALIALIYLLSFREIDPDFVSKASVGYTQAKRLCKQLKLAPPIGSQKAKIENMALYFEDLLDGSATPEQLSRMIQID